MLLYLNYPSWIHPEIFPGVKFLGLIRWYGLMYCFAFLTAYFVLKKVAKEGALDTKNYKLKEDDLFYYNWNYLSSCWCENFFYFDL